MRYPDYDAKLVAGLLSNHRQVKHGLLKGGVVVTPRRSLYIPDLIPLGGKIIDVPRGGFPG